MLEVFEASDCIAVIVEDCDCASDCRVETCVSTIVFNSLIAATAMGIVSEYDKPR